MHVVNTHSSKQQTKQVFGITLNPFIVYTSNIFAIISLRAFYSFIAVFMEQLRFLDKAVALVLGFIGFKMVIDYFAEGLIPTWAALLVVGGLLGTGVGASLLIPAKSDGEDDDDGSQVDAETGSNTSSEVCGVCVCVFGVCVCVLEGVHNMHCVHSPQQ